MELTTDILDVCRKYDIGEINPEIKLLYGDVDVNYKITTNKGAYLLKSITNKEDIKKFEFLAELYTHLLSKNIPVPDVLKSTDGNYVEDSYILYKFIEGEDKRDWNDEEIISLVQNFSKMLQSTKDYDIPDILKNRVSKYKKGSDMAYCHEVFKPMILNLDCSESIKDPIIEVIDIMHSKLADFESLPKQLIDGDLNEMNAIFKDNKNVGIIDIGMGYDPLIYDLGEFCYWFCFHFGMKEFNVERYKLIVKTFEETIPLSPLEKEILPYMILRRHMMDIMLALQWYWDREGTAPIPENALNVKNLRSKKILEFISDTSSRSTP
jgi:Ser/Thr protein kinase RdoA (MazF antagonist)